MPSLFVEKIIQNSRAKQTNKERDSFGDPWFMEAVSNSENGDDKLGGSQGESLVRLAVEPVCEVSGVSQLRKQHWQ